MIKKSGFTLIEMLIVTFVVTLGFMSIMGLISRNIGLHATNKNQLVATVLAQEGIELVRYFRDANWMRGRDGWNFAKNICPDSDVDPKIPRDNYRMIFYLDDATKTNISSLISQYSDRGGVILKESWMSSSGDIQEYVKNNKYKIYLYNPSVGKYYYRHKISPVSDPAYQETIYNRLIETVYHDNGTANNQDDDYISVKSVVYWRERGQDKYYILNAELYNYSTVY